MKLKAEHDGQTFELNIQREAESVFADVDGRHYQLDVREAELRQYLLIEHQRVHDCRVETERKQPALYVVHLGARRYEITLLDPKRLRCAQSAAAHAHGAAEILATMPGKVVRVLVKVGDQVEAGAGIVIVEAMKMQNELKAPKSGTIMKLTAAAGATVNAGEVLAVIE
jgi:biotin carboxyl carrier protein